jgi:hypothetical protein
MPDFKITGPDGKTYKVTGDNADGAYQALMEQFGQQPEPQEGVTANPNLQLMPGERPLTVGPDRAVPAPPPITPPPTVGESAARGARDIAFFNLGDELAGLASASPLPGHTEGDINAIDVLAGAAKTAYNKMFGSQEAVDADKARRDAVIDRELALTETAQQTNPGAYFWGGIGGGVLGAAVAPEIKAFQTAAPVLKLGAPVANTVARIGAAIPRAANLAITGGTYGTIAGAGGGEGGLTDRIVPAVEGGAMGAVLGPAFGAAAASIGRLGKGIANQYRAIANPQIVADRVVATNAGWDNANIPHIAQQVREANYPGVPAGVTTQQLQAMADKFGVPLETVLDRFAQKAGAIRQPLTMADVAGPNTRGLAGQVLRTPGEARTAAQEFVNARQRGPEEQNINAPVSSQGDRVSEGVGNLLGHQGLRQTAKSIIDQQALESKPLYDAARIKKIDYDTPEGKRLLALLERIPQEAKNNANTILSQSDEGGNQVIWKQQGKKMQLVSVPNVRRFDYIKQGLDDMIARQRKDYGRYSNQGRATTMLKNEILQNLDKLVPEYKAARAKFAGHAEMLDALEEGKNIWAPSYTREQLAETLAGMSGGEKTMLRIGAANQLRDIKIDNMVHGANKVNAVIGTPAMIAKTKMIAPDLKSYGALNQFLDRETAMFRTFGEMGNSKTSERETEKGTTENLVAAGRMAASAAAHHWKSFAYEAFRNLSRINPERRSAVMEEVRKIILNPTPEAIQAFEDRVRASTASPNQANQFISSVVRTLPRTMTTMVSGQRQQRMQ